MSSGQPVPVSVVTDDRPTQVVVISHSPLFYWWPVWVIGFIVAGLSYLQGEQVAFVPTGTVVERGVQLPGREGSRDVLITPADRPLPDATNSDLLTQPRLRMATSNNLGILWAMTLCLVILVTHLQMRGVWSLVGIVVIVSATVVFAVFGVWDLLLQWIQILDIHMNAFGYLAISVFLFTIWLVTFFFIDPLKYMIFTRGRLRVRKAIGDGEKVYDTRGMVFQRHRDDLFRHWMLGFGSADLTVFTSGANTQQIEMPNVFGIGSKLALINTMLQESEVIKAR